jgi:cytosine/adenosine deaminase-related metal-dependent hydrolase
MSQVLFRDALIVTMDENRSVFTGSLLVENDRIKAINPENSQADQIIDCRGKVLIPGLIQTHVHLVQVLFRGQADDLALLDWLRKKIWPLEAAHDYESVYYSALLGISELLRGGTTSIIDMATVNHTEAVFQAISKAGIRAVSGKCMMDSGADVPPGLAEKTEQSLTQSLDLLDKWHGSANGRIKYAFNPRFVLSCSKELMIEVGELARRKGVLVHTHASENRDEIALVEKIMGRRNILFFDDIGLTGENLVLAHCIWVNEEELQVLKKSGTTVAHCPSANLKLGSGIAPTVKMAEMGIKLSIGADGAPCNNNLDPFMEMRLAALIQKPIHGPTAMPAERVFEMATLGGAAAMNQSDEIGSIEAGKKADLVLIDLNKPHSMPETGTNIYSRLVYEAKAADVCLTMVDGRILYQDGALQTINEDEVLKGADKALQRILTNNAI